MSHSVPSSLSRAMAQMGNMLHHDVDMAVRASEQALLQQEVLLIEFGIRKIQMKKELANKQMKLKLRTHGQTRSKSTFCCKTSPSLESGFVEMDWECPLWTSLYQGCGSWSTAYDSCRQVMLGLPHKLEFQLYQDSWHNRNMTSCSMTVQEVFDPAKIGKAMRAVFQRDFYSEGPQPKLVATFEFEIHAKMTSLEAAGGLLAIAFTPAGISRTPSGMVYKSAHEYVRWLDRVKKSLQHALTSRIEAADKLDTGSAAVTKVVVDDGSIAHGVSEDSSSSTCESSPEDATFSVASSISDSSCGSRFSL